MGDAILGSHTRLRDDRDLDLKWYFVGYELFNDITTRTCYLMPIWRDIDICCQTTTGRTPGNYIQAMLQINRLQKFLREQHSLRRAA